MDPVKAQQTRIMFLIGIVLFGIALVINDPSPMMTGTFVKDNLASTIKPCHDTDALDIYGKGHVNYGEMYYDDSCFNGESETLNGDYVIEHYCEYDMHHTKIIYCAHSCYDGKCEP